ncbi:HlyD family efflux transporter periplasmic adaptor subunit [Derxia gummosa]|uniref:HlyD family efflux transporter periplasmic adaptor subunit n=1 Tax=Derxia gummosa DSM 723 TaxID=1121388 RepID=A0A8B6XBB8_9BURK|nr:HlyD family efflux transporter periplasmic adaptor subunit [Derxia gummosa]
MANDRNDSPATPAQPAAQAAGPAAAPRATPVGTGQPPVHRPPFGRAKALIAVAVAVIAGGAAWGAHWYSHARWFVETDNAYVAGNVVQVTPQVGGTVTAIFADDTDVVAAGAPLVKLDPADAQVALDQAEAQLGQTVREVRTLFANDASFAANVKLREADAQRVRADLAKAEDDLKRRSGLTATGAVSGEELEHARTAVANAKSQLAAAEAAVTAAREQLSANQALTRGTTAEDHPNVQRAAARVREAWLAVHRGELVAPVGGQVAKRNVQVGQRIAAGTPLMAVVPLDQLWVDANFKEVQLTSLRIGQPVKLVADLYGDKVEYDGKVAGLGAGTGAAFSLLPAQNATGNWIKVVQRVPVRVVLDAKQLAEHPLRIGLSMVATVDVHDQSGPSIASATKADKPAFASAPDESSAEADRLVAEIVARNLGKPVSSVAAGRSAGMAAGKPAALLHDAMATGAGRARLITTAAALPAAY